jgi:hypothetical protein
VTFDAPKPAARSRASMAGAIYLDPEPRAPLVCPHVHPFPEQALEALQPPSNFPVIC